MSKAQIAILGAGVVALMAGLGEALARYDLVDHRASLVLSSIVGFAGLACVAFGAASNSRGWLGAVGVGVLIWFAAERLRVRIVIAHARDTAVTSIAYRIDALERRASSTGTYPSVFPGLYGYRPFQNGYCVEIGLSSQWECAACSVDGGDLRDPEAWRCAPDP